jgi:hypothetical protein
MKRDEQKDQSFKCKVRKGEQKEHRAKKEREKDNGQET